MRRESDSRRSFTAHPIGYDRAHRRTRIVFSPASPVRRVTYHWQRNGVNISGATPRAIRLFRPSVRTAAHNSAVVVGNSAGSVTSTAAILNVNARVAATHVFWYKCIANNYSITDNRGPDIQGPVVKHEGMIMSATLAQHSGNSEACLFLDRGWMTCRSVVAVAWLKDLNSLSGSCVSAKVRAEYRDGL